MNTITPVTSLFPADNLASVGYLEIVEDNGNAYTVAAFESNGVDVYYMTVFSLENAEMFFEAVATFGHVYVPAWNHHRLSGPEMTETEFDEWCEYREGNAIASARPESQS